MNKLFYNNKYLYIREIIVIYQGLRMKNKIYCVIILILLILIYFIPNSGGTQLAKNKQLHTSYKQPYASTPDWISSNPHYSTGAALADLNLDGWLDLIVADGNDMAQGHLNVFYNDGTGKFPTTASWQSNDFGYNGHLDVADVNGDGWLDVAVSYLGTGSSLGPIARVYLNNQGTLSSLPDWKSEINGNAFGVDFGDMNNDGRPDLAVATGWSYSPPNYYYNYVYLNINGTLESSASWKSDDMHNYQGVLWVDADNDSWLDLACIGTGQETKIYRNLNGTLETTASWETKDSSDQDGIMVTTGDVNLDGILDLFATDNVQLNGDGRFKQYLGVSDGLFETTSSWSYYEGYGSAVALADINGDYNLDLATGAWWDYTQIFINDGSGLPTDPSWSSGGTSVVEKIVFGNVGPTRCERTRIETMYPDGNRKLFYLPNNPIQRIINVTLDDAILDPSEFTYSREHGWITVHTVPTDYIRIIYNYSRSLDMVVSNWDSHIGNYLYYHQFLDADLKCKGSLEWSTVEPGETVTGNFKVLNLGDPNSELDWEIIDWPEWGNWTFTPEYGKNLTPEEGAVVIQVEVIAPLGGGPDFSGEIKVQNTESSDDVATIPVFLTFEGKPLPKFEIKSIKGGIRLSIEFENIGDAAAQDVDWNIKVNGGIFNRIHIDQKGTIPLLNPGSRETIKTNMNMGLGKIQIQFTIDCDEGVHAEGNLTGTQILIFILL
jgi:hypothetical protein